MQPSMRFMRCEWRLLRAQPSFWLLTGLLATASLYAGISGVAWHRTRSAEVAMTLQQAAHEQAADRAYLTDFTEGRIRLDEDPLAALPTAIGRRVVLPPGPLSALAIGQSDLYPYRTYIDNWSRAERLIRDYPLGHPLSLATGRIDLGFVLVYLLPLCLIALTYDLLAAERESGALGLLLSQPVPVRGLVLARMAVRGAWVLGWLALASGVAFFLACRAGDLVRWLLWLTTAVVYLGLWSGICTLVVSGNRGSEASALTLVGIWVVWLLLMPAFIDVVVRFISPVPSRTEYLSAVRAAEVARSEDEALSDYRRERPGFRLPEGGELRNWIRAFVVHMKADRRITPVHASYEKRIEQGLALSACLRFFSPGLVAQGVLTDLAGSSLARQRAFTGSVRDFKRAWDGHLADKLVRAERLTLAAYDGLPGFHFREEPIGAVLARIRVPMAFLFAAAAALFLGAIRRLARCPLDRPEGG